MLCLELLQSAGGICQRFDKERRHIPPHWEQQRPSIPLHTHTNTWYSGWNQLINSIQLWDWEKLQLCVKELHRHVSRLVHTGDKTSRRAHKMKDTQLWDNIHEHYSLWHYVTLSPKHWFIWVLCKSSAKLWSGRKMVHAWNHRLRMCNHGTVNRKVAQVHLWSYLTRDTSFKSAAVDSSI